LLPPAMAPAAGWFPPDLGEGEGQSKESRSGRWGWVLSL
jgi:hypothetical protein